MTRTAADKARRRAIQAAKYAKPRPGCPTPAKRAYDNEAAIHKALRSSYAAGRPMGIYKCDCGSLHLTRKKVAA